MTTPTLHRSTIYALPTHPVWGTALAVLDDQPVWPVAGGAADDDEGDTEIDLENPGSTGGDQRDSLDDELDVDTDDDQPDEQDDEEPEQPSKPTPPKPETVSKADFERVQTALKRERTLRKRRDQELAEARKNKTSTADEEAAAKQARSAEEAAEARFKPMAIRASARAALVEAGFQRPTKARVAAMVGRMDMNEIEIDEDDEVLGLEDEVARLKEEFPELFTVPAAAPEPPAPRKKAPRINPADKKEPERTFNTTGERIAAQIQGRI